MRSISARHRCAIARGHRHESAAQLADREESLGSTVFEAVSRGHLGVEPA